MASKLFRAVVGFGIGLGATSAACFGATDDGGTAGTVAEVAPDGSTSQPGARLPGLDAGASEVDARADAPAEAAPGVGDAGVDAPKDVGVDAFCDAAWPTTKGNPKPPGCTDPNGECVDAGPMHRCIPVDDAGGCDWTAFQTTAPFCVSSEWRCSPGTVNLEECQ